MSSKSLKRSEEHYLLSRRRRSSFSFLLVLLVMLSHPVQAIDIPPSSKSIPVIHYGIHVENDYTLQLLERALEQAGGKYHERPLGHYPPRGRDFLMMEQKDGIDIMWGSAREDREARFLPIRIPIFKGLIGWRIPLVMKNNIELFKNTSSLESMILFRPGQHFRWTDTKILKDNGVNVFEANNHGSLMDMLISNKFDYYPRAVIEIEHEFEANKCKGVVIDSHIVIVYPTAFYFYVHKENTALANNLILGLEKMIASGEMDKLFSRHFSPIIKQLEIHKREVIYLQNNYVPELTPFTRKELWLDPDNLPQDFIR